MTRNEPKNVLITIEEIAKIKNLSFGEVKENIFNNAKKLLSF
jgi:Tat protein secretion system quality control protein TatD with DNase activity